MPAPNFRERKRRIKVKSIAAKLVTFILVIVLIISGSLGILAYYFSRNAVIYEVNESLTELAKQGAKIVEARLEQRFIVLKEIASRPEIRNPDVLMEEKLSSLQSDLLKNNFLEIGIADKSGNAETTAGKSVNVKNEDFFIDASASKQVVTDPRVVDGSLVIITATPIIYEGAITGVLYTKVDGAALSQITKDIRFGEAGGAYMINKEGDTIAHNDIEVVKNAENAQKLVQDNPDLADLAELEARMTAGETGTGKYSYNGVTKYMGFAPVKGTGWSIAVTAPESQLMQNVYALSKTILIFTACFVVAGAALAVIFSRRIVRPLKVTTELTKAMAAGDFTQEVPEVYKKARDEFGEMARSVDAMINNTRQLIANVLSMTEQVAASSQQLSAVSENTAATVEEMSASTEEISASLEQVSASAQEISASSQEMRYSVASLNEEMNKGSGKVEEIKQKAAVIRADVVRSQKAAEDIRNTLDNRMRTAIEKSKIINEISNMADLISDIAAQTNLLALNAAIEGARAGEYGRGFTVVAEEIRKLAEQSAQTVSNIHELTMQVNAAVGDLTKDAMDMLNFLTTEVDKDYQKFLEVADSYNDDSVLIYKLTSQAADTANQVLEVVEQVSLSIDEVSQSINQSSQGVQQIAQGTEHTNQAIVEFNESAAKLSQMAGELSELVGRFKV